MIRRPARTADGSSPRRLPLLVLLALIAVPVVRAAAGDSPSRAESFRDFFRWKEPIPQVLRTALGAYQEGRFFTALASLDRVIAERSPAYALDDALFLQGLSFGALGWNDLAAPSLVAVVQTDPPSPYYVPALLALVEIYERNGRSDSIADAWQRWIDRPLRSKDSRSARITRLFFEFGELRPALAYSTRREKSWLSRPKELAVLLESRRERPSDRLLYRSGLALLRLGRYEESLRALRRVGLESPYYPYARYSIAQDLFALGRMGDASDALDRLDRYPKITAEERALSSRARLLHAAIFFEGGDVDDGLAIARSIADGDPEASQAHLMMTSALLEAGKPSLALVYDGAGASPAIGTEAKRALTVGSAYASLGDRDSAAGILRSALGRVRAARLGGKALDDAAAHVLALAEASRDERREHEQAMRAHVADGVRTVLAQDGPWGFATLLRRVRSGLGAGAYRDLALGTKPYAAKAASHEGSWLAYLASDRRVDIEDALERLADLERNRQDSEETLRIIDAYLFSLAHAASDREDVTSRFVTFAAESTGLRIDADRPPPSATFRRDLVKAARALVDSPPKSARVEAARQDVAGLLLAHIDGEIRALLEERDAELRDLELDLDVALAGMLGGR